MAKHALMSVSVEPVTQPSWPSFTGTSELVGNSPSGRVTVYVDPSLGDPALQNARSLISDADRIVNANDKIFGTTGGNVSVIIFAMGGATDGTGGADHASCDYVTGGAIEVCAAFGSPQRVSALFEAELSECSMGGNLCGVSTGEALSRWSAAIVGNNALADFASAPAWAQAAMPDFVNKTDPTDQNPQSTGCGMAFISWLMSKGFSIDKIAPAMVTLGTSATFAQLFAQLTSEPATKAWPEFQAAVRALGGPNAITSDDPFGALHPSDLISRLSPERMELASKIFAYLLPDILDGKSNAEIIAKLQSILQTASAGSSKSHRLARHLAA